MNFGAPPSPPAARPPAKRVGIHQPLPLRRHLATNQGQRFGAQVGCVSALGGGCRGHNADGGDEEGLVDGRRGHARYVERQAARGRMRGVVVEDLHGCWLGVLLPDGGGVGLMREGLG